MSLELLIWCGLSGIVILTIIVVWSFWKLSTRLNNLSQDLASASATDAETRHRQMLNEIGERLANQTQRIGESQATSGERVRGAVADELSKTRDAVTKLQLEQSQRLSENREDLVKQLSALTLLISQKQDALKAEMLTGAMEKLATQAREQTEHSQNTMRLLTQQINERIEQLTKTNDTRLAEISGKVNERLDEGFKKTNETFVSVMTRLATIDEAQKKIDGLTTNVVSLQQLLGDKKSRGAFGEMQLEQIIRNMLPETSFEMQYTFTQGTQKVIADCVLMLPEPVGLIAIDSKFPLENYERMISDGDDRVSPAVFKADVRRHVDAISAKYIISNVTSDGAMMFVPAEAVFAEIHAHHRDVVEYAQQKRVWIVSPTTLMAVLNTVRAVLKDVETRRQIHIIKDELGKLGKEFGRFDERMKKLADHIRQANKDVEDVTITSKKISDRFQSIERVELDKPTLADTPNVVSITAMKSDQTKE
jgi:DNA recombination protein RmuC